MNHDDKASNKRPTDPLHANRYQSKTVNAEQVLSKYSSHNETGLHSSRESLSGKIGQTIQRPPSGKRFTQSMSVCIFFYPWKLQQTKKTYSNHAFAFGSWIWHTISLRRKKTA